MLHPADDGQQARNSCTGLRFFSLGSHALCDNVLVIPLTDIMILVCVIQGSGKTS